MPNELQQKIETLAMDLVAAEFPPSGGDRASLEALAVALDSIQSLAAREGFPEVQRTAGGMRSALAAAMASPSDWPEAGRALQEGIGQLQKALEPPPAAASANNLAQDPELLGEFLLESREHLANIDNQALQLEHDPGNAEAIHSVFRSFHTLKGLAGFLELPEIQEISHEVETVLDRARNGQFQIHSAAIDVVLYSADHLRRWIDHLSSPGAGSPPGGHASLLARIRGLLDVPAAPPADGAAPAADGTVPAADGATPAAGGTTSAPGAAAAPAAEPTERSEPPRESGAAPAGEVQAVRVNTAKLDYLVDMAGEMVIAESLVLHDPDLAAVKSPRLQRNLSQLARITGELQKTAMAMRLVPIGPLFRRMARLVRDLSRQFGKPVELETAGESIEIDRTIVEELADPLMHMVRNALDHGIEPPEARRAAGKDPTGRILLRAHHQAGHVIIEISDDGRGMDRERIVAKAVERGLIAGGEALSNHEVFNLIFEPGFSTAQQVTNVSGRGVGMDVVRRHVEKLRGRIETRSEPGRGSTFFLKLPLTLAIIDGLVVGVGRERYIVPIFSVREMFRPGPDVVWTVQNRGEMALVRGALLPVTRLYRKFDVLPRTEAAEESLLIVAEMEGRRACLMVDELIGKQEVVIKSLGETFRNVAGIAGGAILGDGRVALILDMETLFAHSRNDAGH